MTSWPSAVGWMPSSVTERQKMDVLFICCICEDMRHHIERVLPVGGVGVGVEDERLHEDQLRVRMTGPDGADDAADIPSVHILGNAAVHVEVVDADEDRVDIGIG